MTKKTGLNIPSSRKERLACRTEAFAGPDREARLCYSSFRFPFQPFRLPLALCVRALAAAFDAFVAISLRRSGVNRLARSFAPLRPISEK
jgi:hypothetical protein